jgi:outer membrane protein assembly factor BamB
MKLSNLLSVPLLAAASGPKQLAYQLTVLIAVLAALTGSSAHAAEIADAVKQARIGGGVIVLVDASDEAYNEAAATKCIVHGLETDDKRIDALRKRLQASGRYGKISVSGFNGRTLPHIDNLVNLIAIEGEGVSKAEAMRVLAPRGIALIKHAGSWTKAVKPVPDDIDEWNQYLRNADNNGVSTDKVGPPERLRWTGGTRWGRSHMSWVTVTSILSANGRLFTIEDLASVEYHKLPAKFHLIARDAFNGCELWRKPLDGWHETAGYVKFVPTQIQRRIAAIGDKIYCTLGYTVPIGVFDAATGEKLKTLAGTANTVEFVYDRGVIYAVIGEPYGARKSTSRTVTLKAFNAESGAEKWSKKVNHYVGGSLAVRDASVAYCTNNKVLCCDTTSGRTIWSADSPGLNVKSPKRVKGQRPNPKALMGGQDNLNPTLVLTNAMLYCSTVNSVKAYRRQDGELAWTGKNVQNYMKGSDLFVAGGLVWTGLLEGHDPKTGEIKRRLTQTMIQPMGHDRCYRNRITETYYINSKTGGSDFIPLKGAGEFPSPWVRGTCGLGPLPANGMLYSSPFSCSCLKGSILTGFKALYSGDRAKGEVMKVEPESRFIKGKAYGSKPAASPAAADWPAYRNGSERSGLTKTPVTGKLKPIWKVKLPSLPTAPVIVGDLVYVAARDSHTLYALSRRDGATVWTYTAGGRIDSPPTFHKGLLIFGSRDGWVHSVRAADGVLSWKFCDLPGQRLMSADGQLESAWPVNGAVMIRKGLAYFAAGRSSFLDGGIIVYALDPLTGRVVHRRQVSGPYAKNGFPLVGKRNTRIEGFKGGIFSSEGDLLYIRHQAFKPDLTPVPLSQLKQSHLIASGGFLDDTPQHRTYWTIDTDLCYGPNKGSPGAGPKGDILVMDGDAFYEIRGYLPARHSTSLVPQKGYTLYSGRRADSGPGVWKANWKTRTIPRTGTWKKRWSTQIPLTGNALVVAGDTIIAAGVPLQSSFELQQLSATYAGKQGGVLWTASAKDGAPIAELKLPAQPVWDGLSAAHGQCFIALRDGSVMCLGD